MGKHLTFYDLEAWNKFVRPGEVIEVRIPKSNGIRATYSGYFDVHDLFCKAIRETEKLQHGGAYFTIQVIDPRLLARRFNRIIQSEQTTSDRDVLFYRWLPIDIDPVRPAGISSSDRELQAALDLANVVADYCVSEKKFSKPIRAVSGNGSHLLFRLPDLPINDENKKAIKSILEGLSEKFDNEIVKIDTKVFNPARIWKLYGTQARKGDPLPAGQYREARPHRQSYIYDLGD